MDPKERKELEEQSLDSAVAREPKQLITLGGTAINQSGKLTKTNFFRFLGHNLDDYDQIALTKDEAVRIHHHLQKLSTGSTAMVPMYCGGDHCPFRDRCPLFAISKHPLGKQCLIEVQLMKEWIMRYFEEYDVDPNNFTEIAYINELAEIEILLMRLNMNLAKPINSELVVDQVVGIANDGATPLLMKQISPFMELKDKLQSRRSRIIKLMVGDRQEQYKKEAALKVKLDKDPSSKQAEMRAKLEALARELDNFQQEARGEAKKPKGTTPEDIIDAETVPEDPSNNR
jgi:hypothetical protein